MVAAAPLHQSKPVTVLVADDSIVFRRFLRDILADFSFITICGEAKNGIEALDLILKVRPDVILMDMEMPLMDGMTALQHLMIHCPTPTVMFSSLTAEGTFRAFDALKNGAVDFFSKDLLFDEKRQDVFRKLFSHKIESAARMQVHTLEPVFDMSKSKDGPISSPSSRVIFCEDCGARNIIVENSVHGDIHCKECGDVLEHYDVQRYRRNTFVTVIGGGEDCFRSLLHIIPKLDSEIGGSVICIIKADPLYIDTFSEYLDSISPMKVLRAREGMSLEGGFCYVASTRDQLNLQQFSAQQTLCRVDKIEKDLGPIDVAMLSVSTVFKKKCAGILLSSNEPDGVHGLAGIEGCGGEAVVLNPAECLSPRLSRVAMEKVKSTRIASDDTALAKRVTQFYSHAKSDGTIV